MVLISQISALVDYMESQPELALGHFNRGIEGRTVAKRRWAECAQILNSVEADCPKKSAIEWRSFYNEFKSKLMKKIKLQKGGMSATDGGPAKKITLTPLQQRLHNILCGHRKPTRHAEEKDHAALEAAQARLEQIEARNAEATLAQAQATEHLAVAINRLGTATNQAADRLAAAIEKVGDMISLFVELPSTKKRHRQSSESESEGM